MQKSFMFNSESVRLRVLRGAGRVQADYHKVSPHFEYNIVSTLFLFAVFRIRVSRFKQSKRGVNYLFLKLYLNRRYYSFLYCIELN